MFKDLQQKRLFVRAVLKKEALELTLAKEIEMHLFAEDEVGSGRCRLFREELGSFRNVILEIELENGKFSHVTYKHQSEIFKCIQERRKCRKEINSNLSKFAFHIFNFC